jgi:hypothetical protein
MSAVLLAVFREYEQAERVRTALVKDGFPTDRVELTANREPGQAALVPEGSRREKFAEYFRTLLSDADEQPRVAALTERVVRGAVTVTVHPRGSVETERATAMFDRAGADEVIGHDLGNQTFEQAASPGP